MRMRSWLVLLAGASAVVAPQGRDGTGREAQAIAAPAPGPRRVVTPLDYFASGQEAVESYLRAQGADGAGQKLAEVIARAKRACVQVEVRLGETEDRYESVRGTGVVLAPGHLVLTAGHSLADRSHGKVLLTLPGGEVRTAIRVESHYDIRDPEPNDWALLQVVGPPLPDGVSEWGPFRGGEEAIVLGYPEQIGLDGAGRVSYATETEGRYLEPLVTIATVEDAGTLRLAPRAGAIPSGGMSGGPVLDTRGRLAGIFVSVSRGVREGRTRHTYNAASVEPFRALLARRPGVADPRAARERSATGPVEPGPVASRRNAGATARFPGTAASRSPGSPAAGSSSAGTR